MDTSKFRRVLTGMPGWIVFAMVAVWLTPFWVRDLAESPFLKYWDSHLLYVVIFSVMVLAMLALNGFVTATGLWDRMGIALRVLTVWSGYTLAMLINLVVLITLDSVRVLHYFGGDAGGSPGLLIVPSVVLYATVGAVVAGIAVAQRTSRR
jgi:hypothetical protein